MNLGVLEKCNDLLLKRIIRVILIVLGGGVFYLFQENAMLIWCLILCLNLWCVIEAKNNNILFYISLFILLSNYSIVSYYEFQLYGDSITNNYIYWMSEKEIVKIGWKIIYLFSAIIFVFFPNRVSASKNAIRCNELKKYPKSGIVLLFFIWLILIKDILERIVTGVYVENSIHQYSLCLYIVVLYKTMNFYRTRLFVLATIILDAGFIVINGDRGHAIGLLMILFAFFIQDRVPKKYILAGTLVFMLIMNAIGLWRGHGAFGIKYLCRSFTDLKNTRFVLDTAYAAEASGLGMVFLSQYFDIYKRIKMFGIYFLSIFTGSSMLSKDANLSQVVLDMGLNSSGGGVLPNYGYFYMGAIGIILIGGLVCLYYKIIANIEVKSSGFVKCFAVYLLSVMTDWYLYSPAPLLRGVILFAIVYYSSKVIDNLRL